LAHESWSLQDLLNAGWSEADLSWEATTERTPEILVLDEYARARDEAGKALQIARASFEPNDPRLGTSVANFGLCLSLSGDAAGGANLYPQALDVWRRADSWIARMDAPRVARSSLFHMRMEARNRDIYRARWQVRWQEIADEARSRLELLIAANGTASVGAADALARWRRERPAMLNDTRKLMAAAFLLLAPANSKASTT
jgi:hypothetical protein